VAVVMAVTQLGEGGHCNRISNGQSFVIGIDFRPKWPKSGRDPGTSAQTGPFADFVRIAAGSLPEDFQIASLDASICQVVDTP
jgi:hypothetical protein